MTDRHVALLFLFVLLLGLGIMQFGGPARAHDQYHDWKIPGTTTSCCNDRDCRPTSAWQDINGGWWVRTNGQDISIPERVILPKQPDGRCHICEANGTVFCFAPCDVRS